MFEIAESEAQHKFYFIDKEYKMPHEKAIQYHQILSTTFYRFDKEKMSQYFFDGESDFTHSKYYN